MDISNVVEQVAVFEKHIEQGQWKEALATIAKVKEFTKDFLQSELCTNLIARLTDQYCVAQYVSFIKENRLCEANKIGKYILENSGGLSEEAIARIRDVQKNINPSLERAKSAAKILAKGVGLIALGSIICAGIAYATDQYAPSVVNSVISSSAALNHSICPYIQRLSCPTQLFPVESHMSNTLYNTCPASESDFTIFSSLSALVPLMIGIGLIVIQKTIFIGILKKIQNSVKAVATPKSLIAIVGAIPDAIVLSAKAYVTAAGWTANCLYTGYSALVETPDYIQSGIQLGARFWQRTKFEKCWELIKPCSGLNELSAIPSEWREVADKEIIDYRNPGVRIPILERRPIGECCSKTCQHIVNAAGKCTLSVFGVVGVGGWLLGMWGKYLVSSSASCVQAALFYGAKAIISTGREILRYPIFYGRAAIYTLGIGYGVYHSCSHIVALSTANTKTDKAWHVAQIIFGNLISIWTIAILY